MYFAYTANYSTWEDALIAYKPELDGKLCLYGLVPWPRGRQHYGANDAHVRPAAATEGTCVTNKAVEKNGKHRCDFAADRLHVHRPKAPCHQLGRRGAYPTRRTRKATSVDRARDQRSGVLLAGDAVFKYALPTWGSWPKKMSYEAWSLDRSPTATTPPPPRPTTGRPTHRCLFRNWMMNQDGQTFNQIKTDADTAAAEIFTGVIRAPRRSTTQGMRSRRSSRWASRTRSASIRMSTIASTRSKRFPSL
jgi:hypothetical protein